jgi:ABC-type branched-subunit amino acid transport system substrate-binding protein
MLEAARMELAEVGNTFGKYRVSLQIAEGYADAHAASDPEGVTRSAAAAVADAHTVAWLGSFDSNETAVALPLLNSGGVSAVSATAAATPFTSADPAFPGAPMKYFPESERYGRNFARTAANDDRVALAALTVLRNHGVRRIFAADSGDTDGAAFSSSIERLASRRGIDFVGHDSVAVGDGSWTDVVAQASDAGADAIAWGSVPGSGERDLFSAVAASGRRFTVAAGPALPPQTVAELPNTGGPVWIFGGSVNSESQAQRDSEFSQLFRKRNGHEPAQGSQNAAFAMSLLLRAIATATASYSPEPGGESLRTVISRGLHQVRTVSIPGFTVAISDAGDRVDAPVGQWHKSATGVVFDGIVR